MIKFFRHIRKSHLEQNQMGKYFKYAIGEILLVVVGILIALQINNWNEQRELDKEEHYILKQLLNEFKADSVKLSRFILLTDDKISSQKAMLGILKTNNAEKLTLPSIFFSGKAIPFYDYSPTFNELVSSGKLSIIKKDTIKNVINDFINHNTMLETTLYPGLLQKKTDYMNHVYKYFDGEINGLLWSSRNESLFKDLRKDFKGFANDSNSAYAINKMIAADSEVSFIYKRNILRKLTLVITLLRKELKQND